MQIENIVKLENIIFYYIMFSLTNTRVWNSWEGGCLQCSLACITCCKPWTWTKRFILLNCCKEYFLLSLTTDNKDLMQLEISLKHFYKLSQFKLVHMLGLRQGKADAKKQ